MNDNLQDPTWQWLFVSTSGKVTTVRHKIGDKNAISAKTDNTVALTWFVELRDRSNGSGESQRITDAIIAGSDLRYMIVDASGNQLYYEAEYCQTDLWFYTRRELVEKSGIFYQRHSLFEYPSDYSFSDWKVENVDDRPGPEDRGSWSDVQGALFIGM
ncbi:hypothetical protein DPMN_128750 [Dreissena polymorpha]|uniref:Uncharacterized protein n=1 Tax=Dreissena polymorpha TaxID=45954 RepID=A0A9D4H1G1_DREPO|nr:hypothetical protein DPMN_128750 [Dreissena polymorpha]